MSLAALRKKLAKPVPSWQLCMLGIVGGAIASLFIIIFRLSIDFLQRLYLEELDDFSTLSDFSLFITPIITGTLILLFAGLTKFKYARMGIPFVLHRLKVAYGHIPFQNTITQYVGGILALASGFAVGREGPCVHIGAASSSFIGTKLALPRNSVRTLCACGIAAGISASFNTPLAAVIFVMEVILREYRMHIFIPVILASIIGSIMTSTVFGPYHQFEFFAFIELDYWHYPLLILFGILLGFLATHFNKLLMATIKYSHKEHMVKRIMMASLVMGTLGVLAPHTMGSGMSAVSFILEQQPTLFMIISLLFAKFCATALVLGLGIPGGVIGPTLTIGAIAGTLMGFAVSYIYPDIHFMQDYALLGMAGMMASTMNAPLAALLTVVELSNQLQLALPAMIVITTAYITSSQFLRNRSIFLQQLDFQKLPYKISHVETSMQKYGVEIQMNTNIDVIETEDDAVISKTFIEHDHDRILITKDRDNNFHWVKVDIHSHPLEEKSDSLVLKKMPGLDLQSTMADAFNVLTNQRDTAIYVYDKTPDNIVGILPFPKIQLLLIKGNI